MKSVCVLIFLVVQLVAIEGSSQQDRILEQVQVQDNFGQYSFFYNTSGRQARTEQGALRIIDGNAVIVKKVSDKAVFCMQCLF
jgi:hypothetical protein